MRVTNKGCREKQLAANHKTAYLNVYLGPEKLCGQMKIISIYSIGYEMI